MRKIGLAVLLALAVTASLPSAGMALPPQPGCGAGMLLKFDADVFSYETSYNTATFISDPLSALNVVGIITVWCAPLDDLDPTLPGTEYTFLWTGLSSAGTVGPTLVGTSTRWTTNYNGGTWHVYEGSPRNAPTSIKIYTRNSDT